MKSKLLIILLLPITIFANDFGSMSLKFEEKIKKKCGIAFYNSSGIVFKNEEAKMLQDFIFIVTTKIKIV